MADFELTKCIVDGGSLCRSMSCSCRRRISAPPVTGNRVDSRAKRVKIVGSGQEFDSIKDCAAWLRVSERTVWGILKGTVDGGDVQLEVI